MFKAMILGAALATALSVNAHAVAIFDGTLTVINVPAAACPLKKGMAFQAVYRPNGAGLNPEPTQVNIYYHRSTHHIMPTSPAGSKLHGAGNWSGLFVADTGLVAGPSGTYNGTLSPATITSATLQIDVVNMTINTGGGAACPALQFRGSFTKRP